MSYHFLQSLTETSFSYLELKFNLSNHPDGWLGMQDEWKSVMFYLWFGMQDEWKSVMFYIWFGMQDEWKSVMFYLV